MATYLTARRHINALVGAITLIHSGYTEPPFGPMDMDEEHPDGAMVCKHCEAWRTITDSDHDDL